MVVVSSCREMLVKSRNEATLIVQLLAGEPGTQKTAGDNSEEGGGRRQIIMPLMSWATRTTMGTTKRDARPQGGAKSQKVLSVQIVGCNPPT